MNIWRLIAHHESPENMLEWSKDTGRLAVGWGLIGDIKENGYTSSQDISRAIQDEYPDLNNSGHGGPSLYNFCYTVQIADLVIISTGRRRALVMEVEGDYEFIKISEKPPIGDYYHQRKATVVPINADNLWQLSGGAPIAGHNIRWTFIKCRKSIDNVIKSALVGSH